MFFMVCVDREHIGVVRMDYNLIFLFVIGLVIVLILYVCQRYINGGF